MILAFEFGFPLFLMLFPKSSRYHICISEKSCQSQFSSLSTVTKNFNAFRLAGAVLVAPLVNYWWPGLPANLTSEVFYQQKLQDQWTVRVAHYMPWLTYWWNTQRWFPSCSLISGSTDVLSLQDKELMPKRSDRKSYVVRIWPLGGCKNSRFLPPKYNRIVVIYIRCLNS